MGLLAYHTLYSCGPMDAALDGGIEWRKKVEIYCRQKNIGHLNPCDKPTLLVTEDEKFRKEIQELKDEGNYEEAKRRVKEVVGYDLAMVDNCRIMIMKVDPTIHLCGTYWEACYAVQQHKPVLLFCEQGINRIPNWLFGVLDYKLFFSSLEEVFNYLNKVDNNEIQLDRKWKFFDFSKIFNSYD